MLPVEEIVARAAGMTPPLRFPDAATFFAERAMRLRQLASGHAMGDFLQFMSALALAQQEAIKALKARGGLPIPDADSIDRAARAGVPPLAAADWPRDPAWHGALRGIVHRMQREVRQGPAVEVLARLESADEVFLERQADALLNGVMSGLDLAGTVVAAALHQVLWAHLAGEVARAHAEREGERGGGGATDTRAVGLLDGQHLPLLRQPRWRASRAPPMATPGSATCTARCAPPSGTCRAAAAHCGEATARQGRYQSLDRRCRRR
ncbi:MAG: formate dehydrogenase accessory protein FdhE [Rubrivivax sp.]